jgi:fumarate reductase subunit C
MPIAIAIYFVLCLIAGVFGMRRVIGFWGTLFLSVMLTPLIMLVMLLMLAPKKKMAVARS